ncbi:hypothetical protein [uncultured Algibacter sp.]|uniref:hypothetical protein n=1 Tax=uncultured Algibacter sp. TaxID=298659 RepID=UPI003216CCA4
MIGLLSCDNSNGDSVEDANKDFVTEIKPEIMIDKLLEAFKGELDLKGVKSSEVVISYDFEVVLNERTGQVFIAGLTKQPIFPIGGKSLYKKDGKKYTLSCSKGDKTTTSNCSGKFSCGKAVYNCLEEGGCATICEAPPRSIVNDAFVEKISNIDANNEIYEIPTVGESTETLDVNKPLLDILPNDKFSSVSLNYVFVK